MSVLKSKTMRAGLEVGRDYQEPLAKGRYLVYRKPTGGGAGTWKAKIMNEETKKYSRAWIGSADDELVADGLTTLSYDQAKTAAGAAVVKLERQADLVAGGEIIPTGSYTVANAWADYLEDAKRRGVVGVKIMAQTANAHILPALGAVQVAKLSKARITKWHQGIAEQGKRKTGKVRDTPEHMEAPTTEEAIRQRRDSANWILSKLKACLNYALDQSKAQEPAPWRQVKPFPNTSSNRVRFLSLEEQKKLVAGCDSQAKPLVLAGLYTGARYGELTPVLVCDFDPQNGSLYLAFGKGKGGTRPRHVTLTQEGADWFKGYVEGKGANELMFKRVDVKRGSRAETLADPDQWASYDQIHRMKQACKKAGVDPCTFHELRHCYASTLLNAGVPLSYVAEQLGHSDLRMVQKYYGHIARASLIQAVRAAPRLGLEG